MSLRTASSGRPPDPTLVWLAACATHIGQHRAAGAGQVRIGGKGGRTGGHPQHLTGQSFLQVERVNVLSYQSLLHGHEKHEKHLSMLFNFHSEHYI